MQSSHQALPLLSAAAMCLCRLYVTEEYLCFYSNMFGFETKFRLSYANIDRCTKANSAFFIPDALIISEVTLRQYTFRGFSEREACFYLLRSLLEAAGKKETGRASMSTTGESFWESERRHQSLAVSRTPPPRPSHSMLTDDDGDDTPAGVDADGVPNLPNARQGAVLNRRASISLPSSPTGLLSQAGDSSGKAMAAASAVLATANGGGDKSSPKSHSPATSAQEEVYAAAAGSDSHGDGSTGANGGTPGRQTTQPGSKRVSPATRVFPHTQDAADGQSIHGEREGPAEAAAQAESSQMASLSQSMSHPDIWRSSVEHEAAMAAVVAARSMKLGLSWTDTPQLTTEAHQAAFKSAVQESEQMETVASAEFPGVSIHRFNDTFIGDGALYSLPAFHAKRGDWEVTHSAWHQDPLLSQDALHRGLRFKTPVNIPVGKFPKQVDSLKKQKLRVFGSAGAVYESSTFVETAVPFSDCFHVQDRWLVEPLSTPTCAAAPPPEPGAPVPVVGCKVTVSWRCTWTKQAFLLRPIIERQARNDVFSFNKELLAEMKVYLSSNAVQSQSGHQPTSQPLPPEAQNQVESSQAQVVPVDDGNASTATADAVPATSAAPLAPLQRQPSQRQAATINGGNMKPPPPFKRLVLIALREPVQTVLLFFCLYLAIFWALQRYCWGPQSVVQPASPTEGAIKLLADLRPLYAVWGENNMLLREVLRNQERIGQQLATLQNDFHNLQNAPRAATMAQFTGGDHLEAAATNVDELTALVEKALRGMDGILYAVHEASSKANAAQCEATVG
eukprot:TRINITY_DN1340_c0_g1_i2.p1 TRINITY_DN1340_c0_g1~~TRINITY_DN1340_c0_g1_i2.p1  ORF type:complete len:791 (+),score=157.54 TRINITY_DN1340_c0_g1_i2:160-2532(+)